VRYWRRRLPLNLRWVVAGVLLPSPCCRHKFRLPPFTVHYLACYPAYLHCRPAFALRNTVVPLASCSSAPRPAFRIAVPVLLLRLTRCISALRTARLMHRLWPLQAVQYFAGGVAGFFCTTASHSPFLWRAVSFTLDLRWRLTTETLAHFTHGGLLRAASCGPAYSFAACRPCRL